MEIGLTNKVVVSGGVSVFLSKVEWDKVIRWKFRKREGEGKGLSISIKRGSKCRVLGFLFFPLSSKELFLGWEENGQGGFFFDPQQPYYVEH